MGKLHQDDIRAKIQVAQLIKVLENQALSKDSKEISPVRLKAAEILLRKSLPDVSAVTISGDPNAPMTHVVQWKK
jgi:hypothetical protein